MTDSASSPGSKSTASSPAPALRPAGNARDKITQSAIPPSPAIAPRSPSPIHPSEPRTPLAVSSHSPTPPPTFGPHLQLHSSQLLISQRHLIQLSGRSLAQAARILLLPSQGSSFIFNTVISPLTPHNRQFPPSFAKS